MSLARAAAVLWAGAALVAAAHAAAGESAILRAGLELDGPVWVGERVRLQVELLVPTHFAGAPSFHLPQVEGALVAKVEKRPLVGTAQVGGETWTSQRHTLAVFARRRGAHVIPPFEVAFGSAAGPGEEPAKHRLKTPELRIEARMPPGASHLETVVTTRRLTVTDRWRPPPEQAEVGDAFTRTVTLEARDVMGMALPPLPAPKIDGLGTYPDQAGIRDRMERGEFTGVRVESVTYVCERTGVFSLPRLTIPWWNPETERMERTELPAVVIEVAASVAGEPLARLDARGSLLRWALGAALALALLGLLARRSRALEPLRAWRQQHSEGEAAHFRRLARACRANDPAGSLTRLYAWLACRGAESDGETVAAFLEEQGDPTLTRAVEALQSAVAASRPDWSGDSLRAALTASRRRIARGRRTPHSGRLPPLNPGPTART